MFSWDPAKAAQNIRKHRISFPDAAAAFIDPAGLDDADVKHSHVEERRLLVGRAANGRVVTVAYTRRTTNEGETTRIINARPASSKEREAYERGTAADPRQ